MKTKITKKEMREILHDTIKGNCSESMYEASEDGNTERQNLNGHMFFSTEDILEFMRNYTLK